MKIRIITGVIAALLFIILLIVGGIPLRIGFILLSFLAMVEMKMSLGSVARIDHIITAIILGIMYFIPMDVAIALAMLYFLVSLCLAMMQKTIPLQKFINNAFIFTYVGIPMYLLWRAISYNEANIGWVLIFLVAWGTDTFAYFLGSYFGSKQLAPYISPKKSVEGAIGGLLGAIILAILYKLIFLKTASLGGTLLFAFMGSIVAQLGDLAASYIKRNYNIKDYGFILPGHGGIMDRFDSVTVVTILYYLMFGLMY